MRGLALGCLLLTMCHTAAVSLPSPAIITFETLTDGMVLTRHDDKSPALDGIQIDVALRVAQFPAGAQVTLDGGGPVLIASPDGDRVVFSEITLPFGLVTLTARLNDARVDITLDVRAEGAVCAFVTPNDGDVLTQAQTLVVVACEGIAANERVTLGIADRRPQTVPIDANGRARLEMLTLAEGPNTLVLSHPLLGEPDTISVVVDTGRCLAALAPPDATVFPFDSARDPPIGTNAPVRTLRFTTTCAVGSSATLTLHDATDATSHCSAMADVVVNTPVVDLGDGARGVDFVTALAIPSFTASVRVVEDAARSGEALPNRYVVDAQPPSISSLTPATGSIVEGAQVTVHADVFGVSGDAQTLTVMGPDGVEVPYDAFVQGFASECGSDASGFVEWVIAPPDGETTLFVRVVDGVGNIATASSTVFFIATPPVLTLTSPPAETLLTLQDDVDPADGLQVDVTFTSTGAFPGSAATLTIPGQAPTYFVFTGSPQTVRVTLADGSPIAGVHVSVTLPTGSVARSDDVRWFVDATPPFLFVTAPRDGDVVSVATQMIEAQFTGELGDRQWRVWVNDTLAASETIAASTSEGEQIFRALGATLAAGDNAIRVEVDDRTGAKRNTTAQTVHVFLAAGPPDLTWGTVDAATQDVAATLTTTGAPGVAFVDLAVTDQSSVAPDGTSDRWGRFVRVLPASGAGDVALVFSLPAHEALRVWARVTRTVDGMSSAWVPHDLTIDPGTPATLLRITSPFEGDRTNGASVTVQVATAAGTKTCVLALDGTDADSVTSAAASFTLNAAPTAGPHTLQVHCDAGSGPFFSQRVNIEHRTSAPAWTFVDGTGVHLSAAPAFVNALAFDSAAAAGFQHDVAATIDAPDGAQATLTVTRLSDASVLATVNATIVSGQASFRDVTLAPDVASTGENVRLALAYTDTAFGAITLSRDALVDRVAPTVTLLGCPASIPRFNSYDVSTTFDLIEWNAAYTTTGVADGATLTTDVSDPHGASAFPASVTNNAAASTIAFSVPTPQAPFSASYRGRAADAAGNEGVSQTCTPQVDPTVPVLSFRTQRVSFFDPPGAGAFTTVTLTATQDDEDTTIAGLQVSVLVTLLNIPAGTTVHLCSTSTHASLASARPCDHVPGKVIASANSQATSAGVSQVVFSKITLVDSGATPYGLAAEAGSTGATPRQDSPRAYPVIVDGVLPRTVTALSTPENIAGNDTASAVQLGSNVWDGSTYRSEGALAASTLQPSQLVFTLGPSGAPIASATLSSSLQGAVFGSATIDVTSVRFTPPALQEGTHLLTLVLTSASGNVRQDVHTLVVDVTPPVILVSSPAETPYTCLTPGACTVAAGRTVDVALAVSDARSMQGGCACVRAGVTRCLNNPTLCGAGQALGAASSATPDLVLALAEGTSQVIGEVADGAGNVTLAPAIAYAVDTAVTIGAPVLEVSATAGTCAAFSTSGCALSYDQGAGACRDDGSDPGTGATPSCAHWYASGVYRASTQGTQALACQVSGDDCQYGLRLLAQPLDTLGGAIGLTQEVHLSAKAALSSDLSAALMETLAPMGPPGLEHAAFFRLQLEVHDHAGNTALSAVRFVELPGYSGAVVSIRRNFDTQGTQVGVALQTNDALGVRHNTTASATGTAFTTGLQVFLQWNRVPRPAAPRCVELTIDDATTNPVVTLTGVSIEDVATDETITFDNVALPTDGAPFRLVATVHDDGTCTSATAGVTEVSGITTANTLPTVAFNRAWLEAARFNAVGDGLGNTPGVTVRAIAGPATEALGVLLDGQGSPGFQFGVARPLRLDVGNATGGTARLQTTNGSVGGTNNVNVTAGPACDAASTGTCVTFPANVTLSTSVTAGTPAVTNTQTITASVCTRAGDCVSTAAGLQMRVNVDPPQTIDDTLVCTGASVPPSPAPVAPDTSGAYVDAAACPALCTGGKCDVRSGKAVVRFTAPGVAQSTVGTISSYSVAVAIMDATPSTTYEAACDDIVLTGAADMSSLFVPLGAHTIAAPGSLQTLSLSGLPVHQRLCFAVFARDDVGNLSAVASAVRVSLLTPVGGAPKPFTVAGSDRPDDGTVTFDRITNSDSTGVVLSAINVGDMDGDHLPEFAVATDVGQVRIYGSKRLLAGNSAPTEIITPAGADARVQQFAGSSFITGEAIAGGDFNGDGFADIAIGASTGNAPDGTQSGTVYIYFGSGDSRADPLLVRRATCAAGVIPSPTCPGVILYGGNANPEPFFQSYGFLGWQARAGRVHATSGADDLILADPAAFDGQGGVFVIAGGGTLFPLTPSASTTIVDLRTTAFASQVARLGPFTRCDVDKFDLSLGLADLDGDSIGDIAVSYRGSCANADVLFFKGGTLSATETRCDQEPIVTTPNMQNIGRITDHEWLIVHGYNEVRAFPGTDTFFSGAATCAGGRSQALLDVAPVEHFGASLDDACNASGSKDVLAPSANIDLFHYAGSAVAAGDWNGDGQNDFFLSSTGPRSRVYVITKAAGACSANGFRIIAELSGNSTSNGEGFGVHLFNAGAGTLGSAGRVGGGSNDFGVWLLR